MSRPVKYSPKVVKELVELARQGHADYRLAEYAGISRQTIHRWRKKYPKLDGLLNDAKEEGARETIEVGLRKLAEGSTDETTTDKFVICRKMETRCPDTGEIIEKLIPVERTKVTKHKAPESKAIEILARKYFKDFDPKAKENELMDNILEGFTMRELQESRKHNPIDEGESIEVEFTELTSSD